MRCEQQEGKNQGLWFVQLFIVKLGGSSAAINEHIAPLTGYLQAALINSGNYILPPCVFQLFQSEIIKTRLLCPRAKWSFKHLSSKIAFRKSLLISSALCNVSWWLQQFRLKISKLDLKKSLNYSEESLRVTDPSKTTVIGLNLCI